MPSSLLRMENHVVFVLIRYTYKMGERYFAQWYCRANQE